AKYRTSLAIRLGFEANGSLNEMTGNEGLVEPGFVVTQIWRTHMKHFFYSVLIALALAARPALGAAPSTISFQGRLLDNTGSPATGTHNLKFAIYTEPTGGVQLWEETQSVPLDDGFFSVSLGTVVPLPPAIFGSNGNLWLGMTVDGDAEMTPR